MGMEHEHAVRFAIRFARFTDLRTWGIVANEVVGNFCLVEIKTPYKIMRYLYVYKLGAIAIGSA